LDVGQVIFVIGAALAVSMLGAWLYAQWKRRKVDGGRRY
jgi:hypothetical protein